MSSKIQKTIERQQARIAAGEYYEAHQQLRVIASRYTKASNWAAATDILYSGAQALLQAGQGGSGADLCILLLDVYTKGEVKCDAESKGRLLGLLRAFPKGEPTRKKFVGELVAWSAKAGEYPAGDPEIHHVAGSLYAEDLEPYDAERHLVLGTKDSPATLATLHYAWYTSDSPHTAPLYVARGIIPYLVAGNLRAANKFNLLFTSSLQKSPNAAALSIQEVSTTSSDLRVYPSLPLLNFLNLLLLAVERGEASLFRQLRSHYASNLKDVNWGEALDQIGEMYFKIKIPRQGNPMMDMIGNMFGGGGGGGAPKGRSVGAPPVAGLD